MCEVCLSFQDMFMDQDWQTLRFEQEWRFRGKLSINREVGFFTGPAEDAKSYKILFDKRVLAKYITLQRLRTRATLEINEVMIIIWLSFDNLIIRYLPFLQNYFTIA